MTVTVRFAPSPTGNIHIGNARTALFNWLFARQQGGRLIQRFDDTDVARSKQEYADNILEDLNWLGIEPSEVHYQSKRFDVYARAVETLKAAGLLYACYETADELELKRKVLLSRRLPPVYGREALKLTDEDRARLEAEGRTPHWRFLLPNFETAPFATRRSEVEWNDLVRGPEKVDLASLSDPVLVRADGTYLYTLPSVVDDIDLGVTHVIRGDDHVTNTGVQIAIFKALGAVPPQFGHHNLLTAASGEGLSKRTGSLSIRSLRADGIEPMAVASLAVLTGTSENVIAARDMGELAAHFDIAATSRSASKFDPADLVVLNRALLHNAEFATVETRLARLGVTGPQAADLWLAVRGNLDRLSDAAAWWRIVNEGPEPYDMDEADRDFARAAFDALPPEPWNRDTFKLWMDAAKAASGRKGKQLFMPIRLAITGRQSGPELADLLPLVGRAGMLARRP
ncbi:MAG: glutamate--tRNA ligase [Mesorhizobium sp.]